MFQSLSVLLVLMLAHLLSAQDALGPTVFLRNATLTGISIPYDEPNFLNVNKTIDAYLGVPFARPPVGDLRFKRPEHIELRGEYNVTKDRDQCLQWNALPNRPNLGRKLSEDCLYLSIYTPSPKPNTPTPVMVWIHGGSYTSGGGSSIIYEPITLVALSDIIVVNVNYRLGVFGFLTTGDSAAPGNYGMLDQVQALQWIQDNIYAFGGDPDSVTISGESAGSSSVSLHTLSPLSRGMFQQTIMQSGNAICPWAWSPIKNALQAAHTFAAYVNCPTDTSDAMIICLREKDANDLMNAQLALNIWELTTPVVDDYFLPDIPIELIKRRRFQVLPALMGTNEDEGGSTALAVFPDYLFSQDPPIMNISLFKSLIPSSVFFANTEIEIASVEHAYIDWSVADNATADQLDGFIRLITDQTFACPNEVYSRALEAAGAEIYRYEMTHDPSWSIYAGIPKWIGASHAEDLQYVFAWGLNPTAGFIVGQTYSEKTMSVQFMRYWTNFVRSGNPNEPLNNNEYPPWPVYTLPEQEYKKLSLNMTNGRAMRAAACSFWMNFIPGLHIQAAPIEEVYEDWKEQNRRWSEEDMTSWMTEFDIYKESVGTCPQALP